MTQALTVEWLKSTLATQHLKALNNFFEGDEKKTLKFLSAVAYCIQSTPKLLECTQESIISSFMKCAEYNLFPSSVSGEAYILPYERKSKVWENWVTTVEAQFQLGYQGIITLLFRAWVSSIYTDIVKKNDHLRVTGWLNPNIEHEYALANRGDAIGVYVVCTLNGQKLWKYMAKDEVLAFKEFSKSKASEYSPWNPKNDPELNMWRKTAIKQISKILPKTPELILALEKDNDDSDLVENAKNQMLDRAKRPSEWNVSDLLNPPAPVAPPPVVEWTNIVPPTPTSGTSSIVDAV